MVKFGEVPLPLGGLHLFTEKEKQPPGTTVEMVNCRTVDVTTGRRRLSQRPGLSKHNSTPLDLSLPIMDMVGFTTPNQTIDYSTIDGVALDTSFDWASKNENGQPALSLSADGYGNLYALDGPTAVSIYNPDGELVNTVSPTLEHDELALGVVLADLTGGFLVAASYSVTGGSTDSEESATVHRYKPDEDYEYTEAWTINPGGYVVDALLERGQLYLLVNVPSDNRASVQLWDSIQSSSPAKRREWEVPYPASSIAVRDDGNVFVASQANPDRGKTPDNPNFSGQSVVWTPTEIDEYKKRIWSWFDAADIGELVGMDDGNEVVFWPDKSGNNRDLYLGPGAGASGPIWREKGFGNKPSVEFRGKGGGYQAAPNAASTNVLISGPNLSHFDKNKDDQRGIIPAYAQDDQDTDPPDKFSKFCLVMLIRPTLPAPTLGDEKAGVPIAVGSSSTPFWPGWTIGAVGPWYLQVNWKQEDPWPGTSLGTAVSLIADGTGGAGGTPGHGNVMNSLTPPIQTLYGGDSNNNLSCALVTIYGCADYGVPASATSITSLFRVNGVPIDRWSMTRQLIDSTGPIGFTDTEQATGLGSSLWTDTYSISAGFVVLQLPYQGDISEMVCFHWQDDADAITAPKTLLFAGEDGLGVGGEIHGAHSTAPDELTRIEGYLAHKYGVQHVLPNDTDVFEHPFWKTAPTISAKPTLPNLFATHALLTKWGPDGSFKWATGDIGGTGLGVAVGEDGSIFSSGDIGPGDQVTLRRIIDISENDYSIDAADEAWESALPRPDLVSKPLVREDLHVDRVGNLYVPRYSVVDPSTFSLVVVTQDPSVPGGGTPTLLRIQELLVGAARGSAWSMAFYPSKPDYRDDKDAVGDVEETIFIQYGSSTIENPGLNDVVDPLRRLRLVGGAKNTNAPRSMNTVAIMGDGTLRVFDDTSTVTTPTHLAQLSAGAPYYHLTVGFGKVFATDGSLVVFYDPEEDEVDELKSNTYGTAKFRPAILEVWRNRLVGMRFENNPQDWFMSAVGDGFDHDLFPPVAVSTQAVAGTSPEGSGLVPDAITGFAPVSDDWAVIGCDSSIFQLTGDPMLGGQHDLVSAEIGMAFGRAWVKDDHETLYFVGTDGTVYSMQRGERPLSMTETRIQSLLREIDFTKDFVRLVWDQGALAFYVVILPYAPVGTAPAKTEVFTYSRRDGAWTQDEYALGLRSVAAINGDKPDDRRVLFGGHDGYVRFVDPKAASDDGAAIYSHVLVGPLIPAATANEWLLERMLAVMASELGAVQYEVLSGNTADTMKLVASGTFEPGRGLPVWVRRRGTALWIRFTSAAPEITWACESLQVAIHEGGPARMFA